jgi:cyclohexa-1,5-dienecarbonyl-CoA hydratase
MNHGRRATGSCDWSTADRSSGRKIPSTEPVSARKERFRELSNVAIKVDKKERVVRITLDRPPLNVLDIALLRELDAVLTACAAETESSVMVLQGAGQRAFSAGVDIRDHTRESVPEMLGVVHGVIRKLFMVPQVTVALVQGVCLGGGCELATSCDFVLASEDSSFATPEIHVGCYPPVALARFSSLVGYHRAAEMILTGRRFSAEEALAMGLINRVLPSDRMEAGLGSLLEELLGKSGAVLRITLKGLREFALKGFFEALRSSEDLYREELLRTEDVEEGIRAFLEKRKPRWTHR